MVTWSNIFHDQNKTASVFPTSDQESSLQSEVSGVKVEVQVISISVLNTYGTLDILFYLVC